VVAWLFDQSRRLPGAVQRRLNREQLAISPFVKLELAYMHEIGRASLPAEAVIDELSGRLELVLADVAASAVCDAAVGLSWTRDPFDRLIAAHALASRLTLITRDERMRRHLPLAWWED
jgi:PIN domain nuclease of toxin-antitoxin system